MVEANTYQKDSVKDSELYTKKNCVHLYLISYFPILKLILVLSRIR